MIRPFLFRSRKAKKSARPTRRLRYEPLEHRTVLATLSGFVYIDTDQDAVRDTGEQGVPGVVITLTGTETTGSVAVNRTTLTGNDGSYQFANLNAGTYSLSEGQPDPLGDGAESTSATGATVGADQITNIALATDQTIAEINFGERHVLPQFVSIRMFLASTPDSASMLRETIADSEEVAGNTELANSIRAGATQPPVDTGPNDAPVAFPETFTVAEDGTLNTPVATGVLANDTDADGDALNAQLVTNVTNGTLTLNPNGSFTYVPAADFSGTTTFTYRANDGEANSAATTVTINVTAVNDAPVANNNTYSVVQNGTLNINATNGVVTNDTDAEGSALTTQLVTTTASGTLTLNGDGSFTYIPNTGFVGADSFVYRVSDGNLTSGNATATINVTTTPNTAPTAVANIYSIAEGATLNVNSTAGVLTNDTDAEGNPLTAVLVSNVTNGTLTLSPNGSFIYVPTTNFAGTATFTYQASDGTLTSNTVTVTITVTANTLFPAVTVGDFDDPGLVGLRTDLVSGAPVITSGHVNGDIDYSAHSNPPTYGDHHGSDPTGSDVNPGITPRPTGVYTTEEPDEDLVHNLEHGHVWISYDPGLISASDLAALQQFVRDGSPNANGGGVGVILTARAANTTTIAVASWARLLTMNSYEPIPLRAFVETNRGKAPEGFITP